MGWMYMKHLKRYSCSIIAILLAVFLVINAISISLGATLNEDQVQVPLVIDVSYAVAGVEFAFEYSSGLEFVSYEKSTAVSSALNTPVVVKNGRTYLGFYNVDNRYVPENGKIDCGYLVFNRSSNDSQSVKLSEIKIVQVVDKETTRSTLLSPVELKISPKNNTGNTSVTEDSTIKNKDNNDGTTPADTKNPSATNNTDDLSSGIKNQPETRKNNDKNSDNGTSAINNSIMSDSKDSWLSIGFWIGTAILIIAVCGVGVFIALKKRANSKQDNLFSRTNFNSN
jgi:uncharacterized membrane protein